MPWLGGVQSSQETPPLLWLGKYLALSEFDLKAWRKATLKDKMKIGALSWVKVYRILFLGDERQHGC